MRKIFLICVGLSFCFKTYARNVQQAECVGPAGAPVAAIYFHGLFPPSGTGNYYINLETSNRDQLTALANSLNIRIAIPLAKGISSSGYRDWLVGKTLKQTFADAEAESAAVCQSALLKPRTLIGFSEGGYFARSIALACNTLTNGNYSLIMMSGAKPRAPASALHGCPDLVVASGALDTSTDVCAKPGHVDCVPFKTMAARMKALYPNLEIEVFPGKHILPPNSLLSEYL